MTRPRWRDVRLFGGLVVLAALLVVAIARGGSGAYLFLGEPLGNQGSQSQIGYQVVTFASNANYVATQTDYRAIPLWLAAPEAGGFSPGNELVLPSESGGTWVVWNGTGVSVAAGGGLLDGAPNGGTTVTLAPNTLTHIECTDGTNFAAISGGGSSFDSGVLSIAHDTVCTFNGNVCDAAVVSTTGTGTNTYGSGAVLMGQETEDCLGAGVSFGSCGAVFQTTLLTDGGTTQLGTSFSPSSNSDNTYIGWAALTDFSNDGGTAITGNTWKCRFRANAIIGNTGSVQLVSQGGANSSTSQITINPSDCDVCTDAGTFCYNNPGNVPSVSLIFGTTDGGVPISIFATGVSGETIKAKVDLWHSKNQ